MSHVPRSSLVLVVAVLQLAAMAGPADAQPRPQRRAGAAPTTWLSASAALLQPETIVDGRTNAAWEFARNVVQYRATLEYALAGGATLGVQGSWAPAVPTTVRGLGLVDRPPLAECAPACAASADLLGLAAVGHIGGGTGLHQVIEATAGILQLRNLRLDGGTMLPPERDTDVHASVAYGIGFGLSARAAVTLVQEFGIVSHQRDFLPRDRSGITQQRATRLAIRVGSGTRR